MLIKFQHSRGGTQPVAFLSDFGCAAQLDKDGKAVFRGARTSVIPEVAASTWAREGTIGAKDAVTSRTHQPPHVTPAADVWLLGSRVLPQLLRVAPESEPESKHLGDGISSILTLTLQSAPAERLSAHGLVGKLNGLWDAAR